VFSVPDAALRDGSAHVVADWIDCGPSDSSLVSLKIGQRFEAAIVHREQAAHPQWVGTDLTGHWHFRFLWWTQQSFVWIVMIVTLGFGAPLAGPMTGARSVDPEGCRHEKYLWQSAWWTGRSIFWSLLFQKAPTCGCRRLFFVNDYGVASTSICHPKQDA
jgi:hypothetical protein